MKTELANEALKATPPLVVVASSVTNTVDWNTLAYQLTCTWLVVQVGWFVIKKIWAFWKGRNPLDEP